MRAVLIVVCLTSVARAQTPTCVTVEGHDALEQLARHEVDRHASHRVASSCTSRIQLEVLELEGHRWLTGRVDGSVPHRIEVEDLAEATEEMITILLHNDPNRLLSPEDERGLGGALRRLRREGGTLWSIELFQLVGVARGQLFIAPGLALAFRREHRRWALAFYAAIATRTSRVPDTLALLALGDVAFDLRYAFSADADASGFIGMQLGLEHIWMRGPLTTDPNRRESANRTGLFVGVRFGVELFRTTRSRLELFTQVDLPLFRAGDEEGLVFKEWLPTARIGVALAL